MDGHSYASLSSERLALGTRDHDTKAESEERKEKGSAESRQQINFGSRLRFTVVDVLESLERTELDKKGVGASNEVIERQKCHLAGGFSFARPRL